MCMLPAKFCEHQYFTSRVSMARFTVSFASDGDMLNGDCCCSLAYRQKNWPHCNGTIVKADVQRNIYEVEKRKASFEALGNFFPLKGDPL